MLHKYCISSSKTWRFCSCPHLSFWQVLWVPALLCTLSCSRDPRTAYLQPWEGRSTFTCVRRDVITASSEMHFGFVFVFKGSSHMERSKLRYEPWLCSLEDHISSGRCWSGSATVEVLNSGVGAEKGDWGSTELMEEEEAAKEASLTAPSHEVTAWLNVGCDCQCWHPTEPLLRPRCWKWAWHTSLMLLSPKAAPALCYMRVTCINTTEIKRREYYMEQKQRGRRKLCSSRCIQW